MDNKIKVLWFCNATFSNIKPNSTGTWLNSMSDALVETDKIQLFNITQSSVKNITKQDYKSINQWLIPYTRLDKNGLPSLSIIKAIQKIVDDIKPDIIHIWGTESYWGLLTARGFIKGNVILEIQGLKFAIEKYFYSGMSIADIFKCFRLKEFLKPSVSLFAQKRKFKKWGEFEKEMLTKHVNVSTQSNWVRAYVTSINAKIKVFNTYIPLRIEFTKVDKWQIDKCVRFQVFTSISSITSYKGLHILINAIAILKQRYPKIKLVIAGNVVNGIRQGGYTKWLKNKIKSLDIEENIVWLGSLNAKDLILHMKKANAVVIPSFVESYCLALEESLTIGAPTVVSFAGAMPELAKQGETALFFPPGDICMCANSIHEIFESNSLATYLSENAYNEKKSRDNLNIAKEQISIYNNILKNEII